MGGDATITHLAVLQYLSSLQERGLSANVRHQAYRVLRTWFKWGLAAGVFHEDYLRGLKVEQPKLPPVPTEDEVRAVLRACRRLPSESRNRAIILLLADTGIRASELRRLRVEDWHATERVIFVRGKGQKDRTVPFGLTTMRAVRQYFATRRSLDPSDLLFVTTKGKGAGKAPIQERNLGRILERLSERAGLEKKRHLHPHALRGFACTNWLRNGIGLDECRRLLGHESLSTTLLYSRLVNADLVRAHRTAGAIDRMNLD